MPHPIIRLHDCPPRPWKNGLGRTREIAVHPPAAGMDDFLWRVSIAEVGSAAPFSSFPGIDRTIALLDGEGFTMTLDDGRTHALTAPCEPFAFPGEAQVAVRLAGGPTRDFNLMVRRAQARGGLQVRREPGEYRPDPAVALVYCARGAIDTEAGRLHAGDAWQPDGSRLVLRDEAIALVVRIMPAA
ncbi:histidine utilization protein HutD [Frateuria sp. Soil773]|uniref:HutD/Ves family protein n=1 Tax=Frateuria sp. Soil773 TaxID=1736407 RepID=UPI0006F41912|nr:HutD family protein [Frateuria sp. Soil773]KRE96596.1 histidine utilization protein HutD [Frateuria sp. Soil773]